MAKALKGKVINRNSIRGKVIGVSVTVAKIS